MSGWTTCERCNRVLLTEHGPICPECQEAMEREAADEAAFFMEKAKRGPAADKAKRGPAEDK